MALKGWFSYTSDRENI